MQSVGNIDILYTSNIILYDRLVFWWYWILGLDWYVGDNIQAYLMLVLSISIDVVLTTQSEYW